MDKLIAENLKKLRISANYTQEEVAYALGVTRSAYSNYEAGEREMPYDILEKASNLYGCDMIVFFERNENIDALILASAFRVEDVTPEDHEEIIRFKDLVKSYLKMEALDLK